MAKVYVVDFGSKARRLLADLPGRDLTWSPDAKWLAFQVPSASGTTIYVAPVDHPNAPPFFFAVPHVRRIAWTLDSRQLVYEAFTRDTNRDGVIDERDQAELFIITLQPLAVQPLATRTTVVSPRGHFPGPPANGEYYPPVTSVVQPP
jgi:Tol biopolymer transport system component